MSSQQVASQPPEVFRPAAAVAAWWVWCVVAAVSLADIAMQGGGHIAAVAVAVIAAVTGVMYACALRPRVVAEEAGIVLVNPLREYRVPWAAVTEVDVRDSLRVHCARPAGPPGSGVKGGEDPGGAPGGRVKVLHSWALVSSRRSRDRAEFRARRSAARGRRTAGDEAELAPGTGKLPPEARELLSMSQAELAARALARRLATARATCAPSGTAPSGTAPSGTAPSGTAPSGTAEPGGTWTARWAWPAIAAITVPALALAAVILL